MPAVSRREALDRLAEAVEHAREDDLVEIYKELFPERNAPDLRGAATESLVREMVEHVRGGIEAEEIVDLWNVVFPEDRRLWFDEEDEVFRYNEAALPYAE